MLYAPTEVTDKPIAEMHPAEIAAAYARCLDSLYHLDAMRRNKPLPEEFEYEFQRLTARKAELGAALFQATKPRNGSVVLPQEPPLPPLDW